MTEVLSYCNTVPACGKLLRPIYHKDNLISFQKRLAGGVWRLFSTVVQGLQLNCLWTGFLLWETKCISLPSYPVCHLQQWGKQFFLMFPLPSAPVVAQVPNLGQSSPFLVHTHHTGSHANKGVQELVWWALMFCVCLCLPSEPGEREVLKTAIELQWHWWPWHWPEHTWGSLPSALGWVVREGWTQGCSQESRSCENPNGQLSVLGKEGPALVSDIPQDCLNTALLLKWGAYSHFTEHFLILHC